jgi:hypothetical protein
LDSSSSLCCCSRCCSDKTGEWVSEWVSEDEKINKVWW